MSESEDGGQNSRGAEPHSGSSGTDGTSSGEVAPVALQPATDEKPDASSASHLTGESRDAVAHGHSASGKHLLALCLSALGVVYGDIGTSPLYALRECFAEGHGVQVTEANVYGILSLIFWSLTITISVKYVAYVMRADNHGEGGVLALMALAYSKMQSSAGKRSAILILGLFGSALLYGDGMITPAISVLSAVEGIGILTTDLERFVVPITIFILVGLFFFQKFGTAKVGAIFGPITAIWFLTLAGLGVFHILTRPTILAALSPHYAVQFFLEQRLHAFLSLGSVFLVVTGGEALYADMGHFGTKPIRFTWFFFVGPALILNYLGQGALLLNHPEAASHPFYEMAPRWALLPLVILSTFATIIASQALISGAYSITRQATMLGFLPRFQILHTSEREIGQIYVPSVNWLLMISTILLVIGFGSSTRLAAAYGIAVTTTMLITTALAYVVARERWGWSLGTAVSVTLVLLLLDLAFFGANVIKVAQGGWVPLAIGMSILVVMLTWKKGRALVAQRMMDEIIPLDDFFEVMRIERPARVPGTAVFMTSNSDGTPTALMHNFQHNRVVHQQVILLTVVTEQVPYIEDATRVSVIELKEGFVRIVARYGFMETPDLPGILAREDTPTPPIEHTTFFLGRESIRITDRPGMARWRKRLYAFLARNAARATAFFRLPSDRVVELGGQLDL